MKPQPPRCALGRLTAVSVDAEAVKRQGWREQSILVVSAEDDRLSKFEKALVTELGDRIYGKK